MPSSKLKLAEVVFAFIICHNYSLVNEKNCCHAGRLSLRRQTIKMSNLALTSSGDFTTFPKLKAAVLCNFP